MVFARLKNKAKRIEENLNTPIEDELSLIKMAQNGNILARQKLFLKNYDFITHRSMQSAKRFGAVGFVELGSIGFVGFNKAINTFDLANRTNIRTWSALIISNKITNESDYLGLIKKPKHYYETKEKAPESSFKAVDIESISLETKVATPNSKSDDKTLHDTIADDLDLFADIENRDAIEKIKKIAKERGHYEVIELLLRGHNHTQIAKIIGETRNRTSHLIKLAYEDIRLSLT